jgi:hypothetical protein
MRAAIVSTLALLFAAIVRADDAPKPIAIHRFIDAYRPAPNLILKVEGRLDHSTASVFTKRTKGSSRDETIVVIGAVVTF